MNYSDAILISKDEYKIFVDQSVEVYRLNNKVTEMKKTECSLKTKMARMENNLKIKSNKVKELQQLIQFQKNELKEKSKKQEQNLKVRNLILTCSE